MLKHYLLSLLDVLSFMSIVALYCLVFFCIQQITGSYMLAVGAYMIVTVGIFTFFIAKERVEKEISKHYDDV